MEQIVCIAKLLTYIRTYMYSTVGCKIVNVIATNCDCSLSVITITGKSLLWRYLKNQRLKKLQIGIEKNQTNKAEDSAMNTLIIQITTSRVVS